MTQFLKRLDEADVPYDVVEYGDLDIQPGERDGLPVEWVVWPEKYSAEVDRIRRALDQDALWDDLPNE